MSSRLPDVLAIPAFFDLCPSAYALPLWGTLDG
jgi:hypothetical protein